MLRRLVEVVEEEVEPLDPSTDREISSVEVAAVPSSLPEQLEVAKHLLGEIRGSEARATEQRQRSFEQAWQLGQALATLKEEVGHGQWLPFLAAQWPQLSNQNAGRYIAFYKANPDSGSSGNLSYSAESMRRFKWGYTPTKERLPLPAVAPAASSTTPYLWFVRGFSRWERQLCAGRLGPRPPVEVLRRDCDPVLRRLTELLGRAYVVNLLAEPAVSATAMVVAKPGAVGSGKGSQGYDARHTLSCSTNGDSGLSIIESADDLTSAKHQKPLL